MKHHICTTILLFCAVSVFGQRSIPVDELPAEDRWKKMSKYHQDHRALELRPVDINNTTNTFPVFNTVDQALDFFSNKVIKNDYTIYYVNEINTIQLYEERRQVLRKQFYGEELPEVKSEWIKLDVKDVIPVGEVLRMPPPGGGGGGGGGGLACNTTYNQSTCNSSGNNPTTTNCLNGPSYYAGSDLDGDGCEDVQFSVENACSFTFTAAAGTGCQTYTASLVPESTLNLQGAMFPDVSAANSCGGGCSGLDGGNGDEYGSGPGGTGSSFTLSLTVCAGETIVIWTDGYAGDAGNYTITINCPVTLPVELLSWGAETMGKNVTLKWTTASETNLSHYVVESTTDLRNFKTVSTTDPLNGEISQYEVQDIAEEQKYYRLKWVDYDGKYSYSDYVVVDPELNFTGKGTVRPNPAQNEFSYKGFFPTEGNYIITLVGADGTESLRFVKHMEKGIHEFPVTGESLPAGIGFLRIMNAETGETTDTQKVVLR